jgi:amino acid transporter
MPSVLIVTPALAALLIYIRRYYIKDPVRRLTDRNFLAAAASLCSALVYIWASGFQMAGPVVTYGAFVIGWALLIAAVIATFRRPPVREEGPSPYFQP